MPSVPFTKSFKDEFRHLISWLLFRLRSYKYNYVTEKHRSIKPSKYISSVKDLSDNVAIMMQGPIVKKNDFTLETIKLYSLNFPNSTIVLSTWNNEIIPKEIFSYKNVVVVQDDIYRIKDGYGSTNLQIKGNKNGLKKILEMNIKYTLKTRTDQRLGNPDMLSFLKNMIKIFPLDKNINQKERLIGISFDTFVYRLYGLSDMFLFGNTIDVFSYFDCKYDLRNFQDYKINMDSQREFSKENICEVYLMTEFLKRKGECISWTLSHSLEIFKNRFIIVDGSTLDFFWPKYSFIEDRWLDFKSEVNSKELTFSKWMRIYTSNYEINEDILDFKLK